MLTINRIQTNPNHNPGRELWPITLTYKLDLDLVEVNPRAEYLGQMYFVGKLSYKHTDTQTHTARYERNARTTKADGNNHLTKQSISVGLWALRLRSRTIAWQLPIGNPRFHYPCHCQLASISSNL